VSSIFLEPVSLGNYCVAAAILLLTSWADLTLRIRYYLIGTTLFLLIGCDGRLAVTSIAILVVASIVLRNVSSRWSVLYLPVIMIIATAYVWAFGSGEVSDNFLGRVTGTIGALSRMDVAQLIGTQASAAEGAADNGIVYFILTQSLLGASTIWLAICLSTHGRMPKTRIFVHAIAIFIPLNLLVSYSFFSIKVASLIWFSYGFYFMKDYSAAIAFPHGADGMARRQINLLRT
jgi:putative polymerase